MGIGGLRTHITTVPAEFLVKVAMQSCQKERQELSSVMVNGGLPPAHDSAFIASRIASTGVANAA
jgi:acid phosphatase family membrane protein YuiD